ncbi:MAG: hypothetical protein ABW252_05845 [Polyangiales bacterium]
MPTNNPNTQSSSQSTSKGAAEAASNRIEQGGRRVESSIEQFEKTAEQAASSAIGRVRDAREQATQGIVQQRDHIANRIHKVGTLLRSGSQTLAEDDPLAHSVLTYVGDTADGIANYVRDATPGAVADDLQSFARRRPGVFFGGAFLLGLAVGRFVKSSAPAAGGGGGRQDVARYGESDYEASDYVSDYERSDATARARPAPAAVAPSYTSSPTSASSAPSASQAAPSSGTSLPYVSAGSSLGATPSSATYGASTSTGTSGGSESGTPSYGSATVGGTGGYASQGAGSKAPMVSRPSQPPSAALREASDEPANPRPHAVREGEGSKS